jgi:hypothetical protein
VLFFEHTRRVRARRIASRERSMMKSDRRTPDDDV